LKARAIALSALPDNASDPEGSEGNTDKTKKAKVYSIYLLKLYPCLTVLCFNTKVKKRTKSKPKPKGKPHKRQKRAVSSDGESNSENESDASNNKPADAASHKRQVCAKPKISYMHCRTLPGRLEEDVAADHIRFWDSASLVYHYMHIKNPVMKNGDLVSCILKCTWCHGAANGPQWQWLILAQGSTSNYSTHFMNHHSKVWETVKSADNAALGKASEATETGSSAQIEDFFSSVSSASLLHQETSFCSTARTVLWETLGAPEL
jgi:hypothetical protein